MDKATAERLAKEIKEDIQKNPLHYGDAEVHIIETIGVGWKVEIF